MVLKTLLALTLVSAGVDTVKLSRTYSSDTTTTYQVSAEDKSKDISLEGKITFKVSGKTEDNKAPVSVTSPSIAISKGGSVLEDQPIDEKLKYDTHNMPLEVGIEGAQAAIVIVSMAGYLPDSEVEIGKTFDIKWASSTSKLEGKGTLVKVDEKDGKKVATIRINADFFPNDDPKGVLDLTSEIDLAQGSLVSSSGSPKIEGENDFTIKIKRA